MVAFAVAKRLNWIAASAAVTAGLVVAAVAFLMPGGWLESLVLYSGIAAIVPAAEPPLGLTARILLAVGAGGGVALVVWLGMLLLTGAHAIVKARHLSADDAIASEPRPSIRRADAHPDAPPRPPLMATRDLGTPFLEVHAPREGGEPVFKTARPVPPPAEIALPADLDQPLSAFDPKSIPEDPLPVPQQVAPLRRMPRPPVFNRYERFEAFELPTPSKPEPQPASQAHRRESEQTDATIHALLERLESGVVRRGLAPAPRPKPAKPERGLDQALATLRSMAIRTERPYQSS